MTRARPGLCLLFGTAMLAVSALLALAGAGSADSGWAAVGGGWPIAAALAVGLAAVGGATLRPERAVLPALAVGCAGLALVLAPPAPLGAALCGIACLAFLLAVRLHRHNRIAPIRDGAAWLAEHRPMLVGSSVTTPACAAAALVPEGTSLLVAGVVGLLCAALLLRWAN